MESLNIGVFEIRFETVAVLTLLVLTIWLGFSTGVAKRKKFWTGFLGGFLRAAVIVLVGQGLVYRAILIEPAYLTLYQWIVFLGIIAYIIIASVWVRDKKELNTEAK